MKINNVHIRNFRKLKKCRIDFDEKQTLLVGANNSGKTSAMTAIHWFVNNQNLFTTKDFTLSNWIEINKIGNSWVQYSESSTTKAAPISIDDWETLLPSLDVWLEVKESEIYRVSNILPSLSWSGKLVGVRYRYEPKDVTVLYNKYIEFFNTINEIKSSPKGKTSKDLEIYNDSLYDFLNKGNVLNMLFTYKYYVLNSDELEDGIVQKTPSMAIEKAPLNNIIKIDFIEASRPFADSQGKATAEQGALSRQLQEYYNSNIAPDEIEITESDLDLLEAIQKAGESLDQKLINGFSKSIEELNNINYPGFQNPTIELHSKIDPANAITHESAVQYKINCDMPIKLTEKYNGLGYQNLLSIYFKLMQFRDDWVSSENVKEFNETIEPIHLVFIEEPEAHLHVQAQQTFIKKAYETLTADNFLDSHKEYCTQLVVSTHSTHIVHEVDFNCLRYFKRETDSILKMPISYVINLTNTFGNDKDNEKFVTRYFKLTDCDLFFADAVILVEGSAERILMPKFINICGMNKYYIAIIAIDGSHAHRLKPLIDKMKMICLIITDIDAYSSGPVLPKMGKGQITNNDTIKLWCPQEKSIDKLLAMPIDNKIKDNVRVAYQIGIELNKESGRRKRIIYPYTFEDSLAFTNYDLFKNEKKSGMGLISTLHALFSSTKNIQTIHQTLFKALKVSSTKARFATDLVLTDCYENLKVPTYIEEGLKWIKDKLEQ